VLAGQLGQVAPELVQHRAAGGDIGRARGGTGRRLLGTGGLVAGEQLDDLLAHAGQVGTQADQDLGSDTLALADKAEEHVLGTDVVVTKLESLPQGKLEDLLRPGREGRRTRGRRPGRPDRLFDLLAYRFQAYAEGLQRLGGHTLTLVDQTEQDVLGPDEVVVEAGAPPLGPAPALVGLGR